VYSNLIYTVIYMNDRQANINSRMPPSPDLRSVVILARGAAGGVRRRGEQRDGRRRCPRRRPQREQLQVGHVARPR